MSSKFNITIDHAVMTFRNFEGKKKGKYGKEGARSFCVYLDGFDRRGNMFEDPEKVPQYKYGPEWMNPNDLIPALEKDNWIITWSKQSEDGEYPSRPYLKVNVNFKDSDKARAFNPKVWLAKKNGDLVPVNEDSINTLDTIWVEDAKIRIRPYNYEEERDGIENGKISAQLKDLCITPVEDEDEVDDDFYSSYRKNAPREDVPFD